MRACSRRLAPSLRRSLVPCAKPCASLAILYRRARASSALCAYARMTCRNELTLVKGAEDYGQAFIATRRASEAHAAGSSDLWRKISFYVAMPLIAVVAVNTWNLEQEHHAHMEALIEENGGPSGDRLGRSAHARRREARARCV